jgi:N-acetylglucosaminyldiphosphoundecaprenol N-acetyl-beta-D-mannosaminyltransferase
MQERFDGLNAAFAVSPPFAEMSNQEDADLVEQINRSGIRILFVGLGCPKQEIWMARHRGKVNAVMLGVGAAFDFHAGVKPQAPPWMQGIGLEWLFRLSTEPRRLWKRYLYHNPRFVALAIADLLGLMRKVD